LSSKLIDFQPTITCVNLKNEKLFEDVTAVAIPVSANEKPSIEGIKYLKFIPDFV
jgi:hypothetical protein